MRQASRSIRRCNARTRAGRACERRVLPGALRCRQHADRPPVPPLGHDAHGNPIVAARREEAAGGVYLIIDCPFCGAEHAHGGGESGSPFGSGDGGRVPHCESPQPGQYSYVLREVATGTAR